jgi:5-methylcytosine-specific restriction endonuclease McrA
VVAGAQQVTGKAWGGRRAQRITALCLSTYGTRCWLCGKDGADSADHVLPRSRGGSDHIDNLRPAHRRCNSGRGNRLTTKARRRPSSSAAWFGVDRGS